MKEKEYLDIVLNKASVITKLTNDDLEYLKGILEYREYKKGCPITDFNEIENYQHIVAKGYLRLYHIVDGKEFTIDFYKKPELCYSMESFITRTPSKFCLTACTDVVTFRVSYANLHKAMKSNKSFERLGRVIAEHQYVRRINKQIDCNKYSTRERLDKIINDWPNIMKDIPQHKIATYLGIAPESLSRIKNNM